MIKRILVFGVVLVLLWVYLIAPALSSQEEITFSPYAEGWQDLSMVKEMVGKNYSTTTVLTTPALLYGIEEPHKYCLLIIGVERQYRPSELNFILDFIEKGGTIIVADDTGYGNEIAREFNIQYYQKRFWDENFDYNESFPLVNAYLNTTKLDKKYLLCFNKPTGLQIPEDMLNVNIIAQGSSESFIDLNDNKTVDPTDKKGYIPLIASVKRGQGTAVFIADSGLFINDMINKGGDSLNGSGNNSQFLMDLLEYLVGHEEGMVVFDESRHNYDKYSENIYRTIQVSILVTTEYRGISFGDSSGEWLEFALFIFGILIILIYVMFTATDPERWSHKFDLSAATRRKNLPLNYREQVDRLKKAVLQKARVLNSMSEEEFNALPPQQIGKLITDPFLIDFLSSNRSYSVEELRDIASRVRKWAK